MARFFLLIFFVCLTCAFAIVFSGRKDRRYLVSVILLGWVILLPLLSYINYWLPFSGGGDDEDYYRLAAMPIYSLRDAFDLTRFIGFIEQPGYPWILSVVNHFTGQDLFCFKLINLVLFLSLVIIWYRIGYLLVGSQFARPVAMGVLFLTPMWFYIFVLRKDMAISVLQSLFLFSIIAQIKKASFTNWFIMGGATLALFPFRAHLALMNILVLLGSLAALEMHSVHPSWKKIMALLSGLLVSLAFFLIMANPDLMYSFGIYTRHRILSKEMLEMVEEIGMESQIKRGFFPLLYLLSETAGFNPQTWEILDATWLRGILAIPWVCIFVPFFIVGTYKLLRMRSLYKKYPNQYHSMPYLTVFGTPWAPLFLFIIAYVFISWQVGDTTRWRIPDMPVIATIAVYGWQVSKRANRNFRIIFFWCTGIFSLLCFYYLIRNF